VRKTIFTLAMILLLARSAGASGDDNSLLSQIQSKLPAPGEVLISAQADQFAVSIDEKSASSQIVPAQNQSFKNALRVQIAQRGKNAWDVQLLSPHSIGAVKKGDLILIAFQARCLDAQQESGEGDLDAIVQLSHTPWNSAAVLTPQIRRGWQTYFGYGVSDVEFPAGDFYLTLHLARIPQTLEIGPVLVLDLGRDVDQRKLPFMPVTYDGREKDAPWRKIADRWIDKNRKADLTVTVKDSAGKPVAGAAVAIDMTRHAYGFGSFLEPPVLQNTEDGKIYRQWFEKIFNKATTPVYWADWGWSDPQHRTEYLQMADWLKQHNIPARGHNLVWPSWRNLPTDLHKLAGDPIQLRLTVRDHVRQVMEAMHPYDLAEMDVLNEPRAEHELMDILGNDVMVDWFKTAHQSDPRVKLFVNDYAILTAGGNTDTQQAAYEKTLRFLINSGAPLDGIGMQGHFGNDLTAPTRLWQILDRFAKLGKPIEVTEFTIDIPDEAAQADYERDFLTVMFAHPATVGVVRWGFWEGQIWKPLTALFRKDWSIKPNGKAYLDLVFNKWWTREKGVTDSNGQFTTRGFLGDYTITVEHKTISTKLVRDGTKIEIKLEIKSE
jgi:endo-1,4-beta-xylanase